MFRLGNCGPEILVRTFYAHKGGKKIIFKFELIQINFCM